MLQPGVAPSVRMTKWALVTESVYEVSLSCLKSYRVTHTLTSHPPREYSRALIKPPLPGVGAAWITVEVWLPRSMTSEPMFNSSANTRGDGKESPEAYR